MSDPNATLVHEGARTTSFYAAAMEAMTEGIMLHDVDGSVIVANPASCAILGLTLDELLGRTSRHPDWKVIREDGTAWSGESHPAALVGRDGQARRGEIMGVYRPDGDLRWVSVTAVPVRTDDGHQQVVATLVDVTEQRSIEAELRAGSERLDATLNASPEGIITIDASGLIASFSAGAERVFGWQADEVVGKNVTVLMPSPYRDEHDGYLERYLRTDESKIIGVGREVTGLRRDGSTFPLHLSIGAFETNGERMFVGIVDDITKRKHAQDDLDAFFNISIDLLCIANLEGYFVRINPAFAEALGYSTEEILREPFLALVHPDDRERTVTETAALGEGTKTIDFENRYVCRDGGIRWFSWSARAVPDRGLIFATARDITAFREAEESRVRLAGIIESTTDLVALVDGNGSLFYLNEAGRNMLDIGEDALAAGASLDERIPSWAMERLAAEAMPAIAAVGRWSGELAVIGSNGSEIPCSVLLLAHDADETEARYYSIVARDISQSKEVERMKNEFVSTVSHELRTPLTSIRGSLGLLAGGVIGELPPRANEMITIARENTDRLIRLINDVLDLDKIEAGSLELEVERVRVRDVIDMAVDSVVGMANDQSVTIMTHVENEELELEVDRDRIVQVLTNLLSNAIKFSPPESEVTLRAWAATTGIVRFEVQDRGIGIPSDKLESIFGRFQQVDSSSSRARGGTGLGLAICKAIVDEHKGRIGIESTVGVGSTFYVELASPDGAATPEVPSASRSLLLVERDDERARAITNQVEGSRVAVTRATELATIHDWLRTNIPSVVLLDLETWSEGDDPFSLLDHPALRSVPVVVVQEGEAPTSYVGWVRTGFDVDELAELIMSFERDDEIPTVLVVEDDELGRQVVIEQLRELGAACVEAADGVSAVHRAAQTRPNLIVLDVGLPLLDGFDVVRALRRGDLADVPLVVYSGRDLTPHERKDLTLGLTKHLRKATTDDNALSRAVAELLGMR
jgi:PAS domain S-box-containing protein